MQPCYVGMNQELKKMSEIDKDNHVYLGDGLYAESTPVHIILRANDHRDTHCTDKVYLEQDILANLIAWLVQLKRINKPSIIQKVDLKDWFDRLGRATDQIMIDALEEAQRIAENDNQ